MDNVIKNININDIIPINFNPSKEERQKIEELVILIKQFGLLDPILVQQKDDKYEIISGIDRYQAALIANQTRVPVIIQELSTNLNINNDRIQNINSFPSNNFSQNNPDIINLSELSKIKLEYERTDFNMNNGQFNNNMPNNNFNLGQQPMNQPSQEPTFGGRFFPSLEDEPTNMNMMVGSSLQSNMPPQAPVQTMEPNNNLIDLTDLSGAKDTMPNMGMMQPQMDAAPLNNLPTMESNNNFDIPNLGMIQPQMDAAPLNNLPSMEPSNNFGIPNLGMEQNNPASTIINLESLQNNNPAVRPIQEPVSMEILNADFGAPNQMNTQFEMPQNFGINPGIMETQPEFSLPQQPDFNQQPQMPEMNNFDSIPNFDINSMPAMPQMQQEFVGTMPSAMEVTSSEVTENSIEPTKDITPVTSTIKNLVNSLTAFGYKINITEEDLPSTSKLVIEIEK